MDKLERKYKEEYSDIPKRSLERLFYLIDKLNIKKGLD